MILSFTALLICQLIGEVLARGLHIPVPGPVFGFALLFGALVVRDRFFKGATPVSESEFGAFAKVLLGSLSLLFIPAGVGIVSNFQVFRDYGLAVGVALVGSTALTLALTALVFGWFSKAGSGDSV